jgi:lysophospholipase L1-like esterase
MNPKSNPETVGHRLITNYQGASRNAASVILTVWLVGIASWFVNANAIHNSALAIEPSPVRTFSVTASGLMKQASESVGIGSVENVIDYLRNRNRDGISLVEQTIATDAVPTEIEITAPDEVELKVENRAGDGIILNSIPILDQVEFAPESVGRTLRVLVSGDSLSTFAGQELVKLMAGDPRFVVRVEWANGSGLTKPNILDWAQYARDVTAKYQPDLVVLILGGSDTTNMVSGGKLIERNSLEWTAEYSRRVQLVVNEFTANGVTNVVWAGPPPVKDNNRNLSYAKISESLSFSSAQLSSLKYLDTFTGIKPQLSTTAFGSPVLLRQADGLHWTREASKLIAIELKAILTPLRP